MNQVVRVILLKHEAEDFPGGPVVKTSPSNAGDTGSIPGQGAKIPHASWPKNQNIKQKQYCNKFNKDFKNDPHPKKKIFKNLKKRTTKKTHKSDHITPLLKDLQCSPPYLE